jgi:pimeloyl-ACP methyl ester carboxylesterase
MQEKQFVFGNTSIFYRVKGQGPVVMLLHGFGEDGNIWKNQLDALPGFQLLIPDLPGSGRSGMVDDMSMEGLALVMKELLHQHFTAEKSEEKIILIGHSMGGYITLAFAEKYPGLLKGFGLFHSSAFADQEQKIETRRKAIGFMRQNGAFEFLKTATPNLYAPATKEQRPQLVEDHLASSKNFTAEALIAYYEAMIERPDRTGVLKRSEVPVLFILGRHDTAVPVEDGLKQCHLPLLSHVHLLEESGHMGMVEEAEKSNGALESFLSLAASRTVEG